MHYKSKVYLLHSFLFLFSVLLAIVAKSLLALDSHLFSIFRRCSSDVWLSSASLLLSLFCSQSSLCLRDVFIVRGCDLLPLCVPSSLCPCFSSPVTLSDRNKVTVDSLNHNRQLVMIKPDAVPARLYNPNHIMSTKWWLL